MACVRFCCIIFLKRCYLYMQLIMLSNISILVIMQIDLKMSNIVKKDLCFSASEMMNFVLYFGMMIGQHVPVSCPVWQYYRLLLNLLLFKEVSLPIIELLEVLISEHNEQYIEVFGARLKPKHHNLLHYLRLLRLLGLLCHLWCMRFKENNLESKVIAQTCRSRVNICKSLAIRHMFHFSSQLYFLRTNPLINVEEVGPVSKGNVINKTYTEKTGLHFTRMLCLE